jgi:spectinomycin phosphotransferase
MRRETYAPRWRVQVSEFLLYIGDATFVDPVALETTALLREQREVIGDLLARANRLADLLQREHLGFTVCHADIHAGNIHIGGDGALYLVDWDGPILAPRERDLMSIGAGLMGHWRAPADEDALFYKGYGRVPINDAAIAYYRYERIIEDIAVFCQQLLLSDEGGEDRPQSLRYLASNFLPGHTIDIAYQSDPTAGGTCLR